jgi:hypothetical protein
LPHAAEPGVGGAQTPTQDSVSLTGGPATAANPSGDILTLSTLSAVSGPSGENPSGQLSFDVFIPIVPAIIRQGGPVTCLAVSGNTAIINFLDEVGNFGITTVKAVDNQPDTFDVLAIGRAPTDCSLGPPTPVGGPVSGGDITVVDAPPLPTSKDQCRNGGWRNFPRLQEPGRLRQLRRDQREEPAERPLASSGRVVVGDLEGVA